MAISIRSITTANNNGSSATISLNTPSDTAVDDVLLIIHSNDFYALSNMPTPTVGGSTSGVNPVTNGSVDAGTNHAHAKSYTKVVTSGGAQAVSVTETGTADEDKGLAVYALTGVDTTTPIDVAGSDFNIAGAPYNTYVLSAISPTSADALLVGHVNTGGGVGGSNSYTPPGSMAEQYDVNGVSAMSFSGATEQLSASGSTGTRTFTPSVNNAEWGGLLIAVKTGSVAAPTYAMLRPAVVAP